MRPPILLTSLHFLHILHTYACFFLSFSHLALLPSPFFPQANPDLASKSHAEQLLWEHFVMVGQFQGRSHRWVLGWLGGCWVLVWWVLRWLVGC
jgi:hypothetical protein